MICQNATAVTSIAETYPTGPASRSGCGLRRIAGDAQNVGWYSPNTSRIAAQTSPIEQRSFSA